MDITEFSARYPDEESCIEAFRLEKERHMVCPKCGCKHFRWMRGRLQHQCMNHKCKKRINLKVGTVMQFSRLPFQVWMYAICMITLLPKCPSALSLHRYIKRRWGIKRYQPVWEMCHKIRQSMGISDGWRILDGEVEVDEAFFTTTRPKHLKEEPLSRGSGSERKTAVVVMSQSYTPDPFEESGKKLQLLRVKGCCLDHAAGNRKDGADQTDDIHMRTGLLFDCRGNEPLTSPVVKSGLAVTGLAATSVTPTLLAVGILLLDILSQFNLNPDVLPLGR